MGKIEVVRAEMTVQTADFRTGRQNAAPEHHHGGVQPATIGAGGDPDYAHSASTGPEPPARRERTQLVPTSKQAVNAAANLETTKAAERNQRPPPPPKPRRQRRRPKGRLKRGTSTEDGRTGGNTPVTRPSGTETPSAVGGIRRFLLSAPQVRQVDSSPCPPPAQGRTEPKQKKRRRRRKREK